ncbi:lectin 5-like [Lotus japonicus]|uniref:lectin 5-like n=1 Tax=Lotus japonicus TaxID=34305 RepID=UPI00258C7C5E|nr:lectin 5-like [Lotus japonicus]
MANITSELLATLIFSLLLITTTVKSDSLSFSFPTFDPDVRVILLNGDANTTNGTLQLTKIDQYGNPSPHSSGISAFYGAVHLSDKKTGRVADFRTEFTFVVNHSQPHGDGFTFFLASLDFEFPEGGGGGGFLGLFDEETAYNTSKNSIVAVEFDSFSNSFDPNFPHIGIDINTIRSAVTIPWSVNDQPQGAIQNAKISYSSVSRDLTVVVHYPPGQNTTNIDAIKYPIDIESYLSEWVVIGFSATTGEFAETHSILSWSFNSTL